MKRWVKEPLLHFLIAGVLLFGAYAWINPSALNANQGQQRQIRIGEGEVRWLSETWARQWHREPTSEELRDLVSGLVKEELLSREARELRLDEGDVIVRRRLAQKLEFLLRDTARPADPQEDELRRFYDSRPERFQTAAQVSFTQIYFSPHRRKDAVTDARNALARLSGPRPVEAATLGDASLMESDLRDADEATVAAVFGPGFAREVMTLTAGVWHGPITSGYGLHLVQVTRANAPGRRAFDEMRPAVLDAWREWQQRETEQRYFQRLMQKYEVVIDRNIEERFGPLVAAQGQESGR